MRVKDPQVTLVGWVKSVGDPAKSRKMIVVSVPPQITPMLVERTLLVNLPDEAQLVEAREPVLDEHMRPVYSEVRCYLKLRVFDGKPPVINDANDRDRHRDPQEVLIGTVQPTKEGGHTIIVVDFPAEKVTPESTDFCATTLIVNIPSKEDNDEAVDCYLKYRIVDENDRRAHLPAYRSTM